ncbi:hypothetical protein [uncultured Enterovirga sp.]|uniref:hypothetical protein n=1 Tax=uncultured Enterovirga sp. TaxID=2026352 RepID=UPI0035CC13C5
MIPTSAGPRRMTLPELLRAARRRAPVSYDSAPPRPTAPPLFGFIRRLVMLVLFLIVGLFVFGLMGSGPLLELLLNVLLNSGR